MDSVQELDKGDLDKVGIVVIEAFLRNGREQVAPGAQIHDNVNVQIVAQDLVDGDDVRVDSDLGMESELANLEVIMSGADLMLVKTFDSKIDWLADGGGVIQGAIDHSISTRSQEVHELVATVIDKLTGEVGEGFCDRDVNHSDE